MTGADLAQLLVLTVVLLIAVGVLLLVVRQRRAAPVGPVAPLPPPAPAAPPPLPAVVVNPTKIADMDGERAWLSRRCSDLGWQRPLWFETLPDDPGRAAARQAVREGARTVIAYGGDGTVRGVAAGLVGSETALAILPMGTGNLLARNLGIPVSDHERAAEVALGRTERRIDVGTVEIDVSGEDEDPVRETFLVMAGLGFDAEVMASVEPALKQKVGWWAYVVAGARRLRGRTTAVTIQLDDDEPVRSRVRSVIIGNCGELTGGLALLPDARVDDGWLDVVVVAPRRIVHWGSVVFTVLSRARLARLVRPTERTVVQHFRCRRLVVRAEKPLAVQLDGDAVGEARVLRAGLDRLGLAVRTPRIGS
jgi:diacylglycerol kinase family enzyme